MIDRSPTRLIIFGIMGTLCLVAILFQWLPEALKTNDTKSLVTITLLTVAVIILVISVVTNNINRVAPPILKDKLMQLEFTPEQDKSWTLQKNDIIYHAVYKRGILGFSPYPHTQEDINKSISPDTYRLELYVNLPFETKSYLNVAPSEIEKDFGEEIYKKIVNFFPLWHRRIRNKKPFTRLEFFSVNNGNIFWLISPIYLEQAMEVLDSIIETLRGQDIQKKIIAQDPYLSKKKKKTNLKRDIIFSVIGGILMIIPILAFIALSVMMNKTGIDYYLDEIISNLFWFCWVLGPILFIYRFGYEKNYR